MSNPTNDTEVKQVMEAVAALREAVESKTKGLPDMAKIEKIEAFLEGQEKTNQKYTSEFLQFQKDAGEYKDRIAALEKQLSDPANGNQTALKAEMAATEKAFDTFLREGKHAANLETKYLRTDNDTQGGYLTTAELETTILKNITEISKFRSLAKVSTISKGVLEIPKRTALLNGGWVGEGATGSRSQSDYGMVRIPANKMHVTVPVTIEMLQDSSYSIEGEILSDVQESFAQLEGAAFVSGSGSHRPEGFMTNASVAEYNTGVADGLSGDSIIEIAAQLKTGYNPAYVLNRKTVAKVRTLKAADGHYLWTPGLGQGNPNTINGLPYAEMIDMPDVGAGLYPIAVGDWSRAYRIVDRIGIAVIRDDVTLKLEGKVELAFFKRVGGMVVLAEGIKKLKCAV